MANVRANGEALVINGHKYYPVEIRVRGAGTFYELNPASRSKKGTVREHLYVGERGDSVCLMLSQFPLNSTEIREFWMIGNNHSGAIRSIPCDNWNHALNMADVMSR